MNLQHDNKQNSSSKTHVPIAVGIGIIRIMVSSRSFNLFELT